MIGGTGGPIVVVGDIITDVLAVHIGPIAKGSDTPAAIRISGGGSAANTAAWLASVGAPVALVGVVGGDAAGADRLQELRESGVDCQFVRRHSEAPTGTIIVLSDGADRSFLFDRGANRLLEPSDVEQAVAGARHVHLSGYTLLDPATRAAALRCLARDRAGATVSVDAASAVPLRHAGGRTVLDWVRGVDLLFANLDEARALLDEPAVAPVELARALAAASTHAVVKLGAAGVAWAGPDGAGVVPAVATKRVVDPTGAGDAFAAGFLRTWLDGTTTARAAAEGARLGAAAVAIMGGRPLAHTLGSL